MVLVSTAAYLFGGRYPVRITDCDADKNPDRNWSRAAGHYHYRDKYVVISSS